MKDPKSLREQAKKLMIEADRIEAEQVKKIGMLAIKFLDSKDGFDLEKFKDEVTKIRGEI
ncbi:MAG TPA: hypothetical protein PK564_02995 [bacterium]|nr:hypothetical protein [bacterium]